MLFLDSMEWRGLSWDHVDVMDDISMLHSYLESNASSRVLVRPDFYCVHLNTEKVSLYTYFYSQSWTGAVDANTTYAIAVSLDTCFVWHHPKLTICYTLPSTSHLLW